MLRGVHNAVSRWRHSWSSTWCRPQSSRSLAAQELQQVSRTRGLQIQFYSLFESRMQELRQMGWEHLPPDELALMYYRLNIVPLRRLFSWAVPSEDALEAIARSSPDGVVEMGAGTGYWAWLLRQRDVKVVAFDRNPMTHGDLNGYHGLPDGIVSSVVQATGRGGNQAGNAPPFTVVQEGGPEMVAKYPDHALFLCWPPAEDDAGGTAIANMALESLRAYSGRTVLYVGETPGSSVGGQPSSIQTGGVKFLSDLMENWDEIGHVPLPSWPWAPACLTIWSRKGAALPAQLPAARTPTSPDFNLTEAEEKESSELRKEILRMYDMLWQDAVLSYSTKPGRFGQMTSKERWLIFACLRKSIWRSSFLSPLASLLAPYGK